MNKFIDQISLLLFIAMLAIVSMVYGIWAAEQDQFPAPQIESAAKILNDWRDDQKRHEMISVTREGPLARTYRVEEIADGLIAISGMTDGPINFIRIIERDGTIVHEWVLDWFEIWGDSGHFPPERRPRTQPGAIVHGFEITDDLDVVFNFEYLSTIRVDACGGVKWKLDNLGHHSVHVDDDDYIWVSAQEYFSSGSVPHQNHKSPLRSGKVQKISGTGEIIESFEIIDILKQNDLLGLLYLTATHTKNTSVVGDTMHLNDIETFPKDFVSDRFSAGDILISLRNINTVMVIDPVDKSMKFRSTGHFLRQHDPDFTPDGDILVFDNRNLYPSTGPIYPSSRILRLDPSSGSVTEEFSTSENARFFTRIFGKHQSLPNGNTLIASGEQGRVLELSPEGDLLWEYNNHVSADYSGIVTQATLLPARFDRGMITASRTECID